MNNIYVFWGFRVVFIMMLFENYYFRFKLKSQYSRFKDTAFWQLLLGFLLLSNNIENADKILTIMQTSILILFCLFLIELVKIHWKKRKNKNHKINPRK